MLSLVHSNTHPDPRSPEALAALRARLGNSAQSSGGRTLPTGYAPLNELLIGGGWPTEAMVELITPEGDVSATGAALRVVLPALADATQAGRHAVLIAPPLWVNAPAWVAAGIDLNYLLIVRPEAAGAAGPASAIAPRQAHLNEQRHALWTAEQSLRAQATAMVMLWLPAAAQALPYKTLLRLQLAASVGQTPLFFFRPARFAREATPAPLKLWLERTNASAGALTAGLRIKTLKQRGGSAEVEIAF